MMTVVSVLKLIRIDANHVVLDPPFAAAEVGDIRSGDVRLANRHHDEIRKKVEHAGSDVDSVMATSTRDVSTSVVAIWLEPSGLIAAAAVRVESLPALRTHVPLRTRGAGGAGGTLRADRSDRTRRARGPTASAMVLTRFAPMASQHST